MVVVNERKQPVIFLLRERIEFVVMALRALDRQAEHALADGIHAIEHLVHTELLRVNPAFFVEHGVAQKTRGDDLVLGAIRDQVAGELFDDELIVREVAIERVDDVIAITPDVARLVLFKAVRVGVACRIKPMSAPAFAVMRRVE